MLINGFVLGVATYAGWVTVWCKLPPRIKQWCAQHSLVVDAFFTFATYLVLGDTLVTLLAAAYVGLLFEGTMFLLRNEEHLDFLYAYKERAKSHLENLKEWLRKKNEAYLAQLDQDQEPAPATPR